MTSNERSLNGKVAVVTGAGQGIGKAIAIGYANAGAAVCSVARTQSDIDQTVAEIHNAGGTGTAVRADVTDSESIAEAFEATRRRFGGIDIVVINAGGNRDQSADVEHSNSEDWIDTIEVNLFGAYHTAKAAIPYLKKRGAGKIITMGSGLGHRGRVGGSAYASAKAALSMLTRVLAQELWQHNISVNELIPGPVKTERTIEQYADRPGSVFRDGSEWAKDPVDVVPLALFLAAQPDKGPTGQTYSLMRRDM